MLCQLIFGFCFPFPFLDFSVDCSTSYAALGIRPLSDVDTDLQKQRKLLDKNYMRQFKIAGEYLNKCVRLITGLDSEGIRPEETRQAFNIRKEARYYGVYEQTQFDLQISELNRKVKIGLLEKERNYILQRS